MKFQSELRNSKQTVRNWVRANFSDQKLASVYAFNADGKMSFRNPCGCLMGVTLCDRLHDGHDCNREHYWIARRQDLTQTRRFAAFLENSRKTVAASSAPPQETASWSPAWRRASAPFALWGTSQLGKVEKAYLFLGFSQKFSNCFGDDALRRRRFSALLRAEMHRRDSALLGIKANMSQLDAKCGLLDRSIKVEASSGRRTLP